MFAEHIFPARVFDSSFPNSDLRKKLCRPGRTPRGSEEVHDSLPQLAQRVALVRPLHPDPQALGQKIERPDDPEEGQGLPNYRSLPGSPLWGAGLSSRSLTGLVGG